MYTYQQTQLPTDPTGELWTTGRYNNGRWFPESDWGTEEEARERAATLNAAANAANVANTPAVPSTPATPPTLTLAMATFERENPVPPLPQEPRTPDEWYAEWLMRNASMEFPRTYERIRRESQEEYHRLMRERIEEIRADFARLPKR